MKIKKLNIKNFRHFDEFELNLLNDNFNLIVGENGVGKTTIFDSLKILFDSNIFLTKFFNEKDFNEEGNLIIESMLEFEKDDENLYLFKDCINKINDDNIEILIGFYKASLDSEGIYFGKKSFIYESDFSKIEDFKINLYDIKKFIQVVYIDGTRAEQNFYSNNSFYTKVGKYLYEIYKYEERKENKLIKLDKENLKENEIMQKIIGKSDKTFSKYLDEIILEQDEKDNKIFLDDDEKLPQSTFLSLLKLNLFDKHLDKNSTGWQYIIFTVFAIFYIKELEEEIKKDKNIENEDKENEEEKYYLILMEEPEAHLHPQMQKNLLNFIKEEFNSIEKSSLLISTHSPNIIRTVKDIEKTIFINKESNISLPKKIDGKIEGFKNKLNIFIDVNKAELLFSRGIIFVEGIAEEILIPKIFKNHKNKTLDNYGISVINVNSTDFYCYALYANSLEIPWVIITDGDITKEQEYHGKTRKEKHNIFDENNYFIGFDTLEIDLIFKGNKDIILNSYNLIKPTKAKETNFENKIDELIKYDFDLKNIENYKDNFTKIRDSILGSYIEKISKSNLAYSLFENIDDTFKIPEYIENAFNSIVEKLEKENKKEIIQEEENLTQNIYNSKNEDEISIEDVPF